MSQRRAPRVGTGTRINPVAFSLSFSYPLSPHSDMTGDILKKRKIAVLGSRSVGEPDYSAISYTILICISLRQESRPS